MTKERDKPIPKELISEWLEYAPMATCNVVVLANEGEQVLLLKRRHPPCKGEWFTPGGILTKDKWFPLQVGDILEDEIGVTLPLTIKPICVTHEFYEKGYGLKGDVQLITLVFKARIPDTRIVDLMVNDEHEAYKWFYTEKESLPTNLHPNIVKWIEIAKGDKEWVM